MTLKKCCTCGSKYPGSCVESGVRKEPFPARADRYDLAGRSGDYRVGFGIFEVYICLCRIQQLAENKYFNT